MPKFEDRQILKYPREMLYGIARDVAKYPEFLPWCSGARVFGEKPDANGSGQFDADLVIGFKMFRERFTSRVTYRDFEAVDAAYIKGPMKHCINRWRFKDAGEGATQVDFYVDFELANRVMQVAVEDMFLTASQKMITAFKDRAASLSAGRQVKSKPRVASSSPFLQMLDARRRD